MKCKKECENQKKWVGYQEESEELIELKKPISVLGEVISSSMYSIEWLRDAKEPGSRRNISNRSRFQGTQFWADMDLIVVNKFRFDSKKLTEEDLRKLEEYVRCLTERKRSD